MQCSVELPIEYLNLSDSFDFDFVIASTCVEHPAYLDYFRSRCPGRPTILDNGAFETGEAITDQEYIDIACQINPDILVVPDVIGDPVATIGRIVNFMAVWGRKKLECSLDASLMGVIQVGGNSSWIRVFNDIFKQYEIRWVGVPYVSGLDRYQLIRNNPEWENVHILGLPHLSEAFALQELSNVKSIDSSLPVKVTKDGKYLVNKMSSFSYASAEDTSLNRALLQENLEFFTTICHRGMKGLK